MQPQGDPIPQTKPLFVSLRNQGQVSLNFMKLKLNEIKDRKPKLRSNCVIL